MHKNSTETSDLRSYDAPRIVEVGTVAAFTAGHSEPVGDPPHDGTTGWFNAAKNLTGAEVDLGAA
jgi:hypothetical protein